MVWYKCNSTLEYERIKETPLWHGMEFHHFGLILSALFGLIAVLMSWYLIWRHCTHYLKPWEQRHIIRVLFMVPIYSIVSFLSYLFYTHAVYFEVIRDCYEAFAIASFFALLCSYIAPDLHAQKDFFRGLQPRPWVWPLTWFRKCCGGERGWTRTPRSGLTWFNVIWFGIFQYCFIRVFMTLVALVTQAAGRYCLESLSPAFAHVWVMVIEGACVSVAMYCLIQFYIQLRLDLGEHKPLLKVLAIKLVIFLSFWQTLFISFLTSAGAIKASLRIQSPDIKIGIPSLLLCIEMAFFSVFHLWAFPWRVYDIRRSEIVASESAPGMNLDPKTAYQGGPWGSQALMDAFNPWDLVKNVGRGFRWFFKGRKTRTEDVSYKNSTQNTGLEPTRDQVTALQAGQHSFDQQDGPVPPPYIAGGGKPGRYQPLSDEEDSDRLLTHAQTNPRDPSPNQRTYPRPMTRGNGDLGSGTVVYDPPPTTSKNSLPNPNTSNQRGHSRDPSRTTLGTSNMDEQDTGYHGAGVRRNLTPTAIPPDPHPLGPPGRKSHEAHEWNVWDGASQGQGESERDLGGGQLTGSNNRF